MTSCVYDRNGSDADIAMSESRVRFGPEAVIERIAENAGLDLEADIEQSLRMAALGHTCHSKGHT